MSTSNSIPAVLTLYHQASDTLKRTITLSSGGALVDLTGCAISMYVGIAPYDNEIAILTLGNGLVASNLIGGEFKILWNASAILKPANTYYYRIVVVFPDTSVRTYLQDKIITT